MHLVLVCALQLPTPITFADWDDFALTIRPRQSLIAAKLTRKRKHVLFGLYFFHLHKNKFRTVVISRRSFSAHSGQLEPIAGVLGFEWFLRKGDHQSKRLLFLLVAEAVLGALAKGRSSAPSLLRAVRKAAALLTTQT